MSVQDLYYCAIGTRTGVTDAVVWLLDNWAQDNPVRRQGLALTNAVGVVSLMEREHPGGYREFLAHTSNLRQSA